MMRISDSLSNKATPRLRSSNENFYYSIVPIHFFNQFVLQILADERPSLCSNISLFACLFINNWFLYYCCSNIDLLILILIHDLYNLWAVFHATCHGFLGSSGGLLWASLPPFLLRQCVTAGPQQRSLCNLHEPRFCQERPSCPEQLLGPLCVFLCTRLSL